MTLTMKVLMVMKDPPDIAGGRLQDDAVPRVPHRHVGGEAYDGQVVLSPHLTQDGHLMTCGISVTFDAAVMVKPISRQGDLVAPVELCESLLQL